MKFAPLEHYVVPALAMGPVATRRPLLLAGSIDFPLGWKMASEPTESSYSRGYEEHTLVGVPELGNE